MIYGLLMGDSISLFNSLRAYSFSSSFFMVKKNRVPKLQIDLICKLEAILKNHCFSCETPKYLPLAVNYLILIGPPKQFHEHKVFFFFF